MPKRLAVTRAATEGSLLIPGVPRPDRPAAGTCSLIRVLWACLEVAGIQAAYDELMGLTGIAFALPPMDDFAGPSAGAPPWQHVADSLHDLGVTGGYTSLDPRDPAAVVEAVEKGLKAGFAVPVRGWPDAGEPWAVIAGSDRGRGVLCGWPAQPTTETYLGAPPRAEAAIILTGRQEPLPRNQAWRAALRRAADGAEQVAEGYARWVHWLRAQNARPEGGAERIIAHETMAHESFCDSLADARVSAAAFCEEAGEVLGPVEAEWLMLAADNARDIVAELEARDPPIGDPEAIEALASAQWREEWAATVQELSAKEARLLDCLHKAWRGEIPPEP